MIFKDNINRNFDVYITMLDNYLSVESIDGNKLIIERKQGRSLSSTPSAPPASLPPAPRSPAHPLNLFSRGF
ncbi:hypothetical protein Avbf_14318 [Armadillidium vulgare]|nr:hypothetical protein Avbf_14318 [Armadillidium vulgare]